MLKFISKKVYRDLKGEKKISKFYCPVTKGGYLLRSNFKNSKNQYNKLFNNSREEDVVETTSSQ